MVAMRHREAGTHPALASAHPLIKQAFGRQTGAHLITVSLQVPVPALYLKVPRGGKWHADLLSVYVY